MAIYGFRELKACPKCGTDRGFASDEWGFWFQSSQGRFVPRSGLGDVGYEALRVTCVECKYQWLEYTLDADPTLAGGKGGEL